MYVKPNLNKCFNTGCYPTFTYRNIMVRYAQIKHIIAILLIVGSFQFLNYDNVSWNNTNAEHAIKKLSTHRNDNIKFFQSSRIAEYLKIMSIYVTCHYKGISFLKFLLSGVKNIDKYCEKYIH